MIKKSAMLNDLNKKKRTLIRNAVNAMKNGDPRAKIEYEMKAKFLSRLSEQISMEDLANPSVFISYSSRSARKYYDIARKIGTDVYNFDVITGFDEESGHVVVKEVLRAIRKADVFLGIMTPEYRITSRSLKSGFNAPSVWVVEEKGMALAIDKPFRLLVHEHVHEDFWLRTAPEKLHNVFNEANFETQARNAFEALNQRYDELLLRSMYSENDTMDVED